MAHWFGGGTKMERECEYEGVRVLSRMYPHRAASKCMEGEKSCSGIYLAKSKEKKRKLVWAGKGSLLL